MFETLFGQSGLSLDRLKTFRDIVSAGGISAAAGGDPSRQSQYSRQLKELERYFGVELLKRGRGPMEITDAGQRLFDLVGHTLGALDEFRRSCAGQPIELTVGAGESLIQWLLLPRLGGITEAHPTLSLAFENLRTDEIQRRVTSGGLDFGVVGRRSVERGLGSAALGRMEFRLYVPASLLPANRRLKWRGELLGELPLAMLEGGATIRDALEREARRVGCRLQVRLKFSSYPQLVQAVQNLGVAAVLPVLASSAMDGTVVREVSLPFLSELSRDVSLIWSRRMADLRPTIARYARLLPAVFQLPPSSPASTGAGAR